MLTIEHIDEIREYHKHIMKDYIMKFKSIYDQLAFSDNCADIDPLKMSLDQYFTGVDDNVWLKLENRPKINKLLNKKISEMMLEIVLNTPRNGLYTKKTGDELCNKYNIDLRFGTHTFMIVKYKFSDITPTVRSNITKSFKNLIANYPNGSAMVGIICDNHGYGYFDEINHIFERRGDAFLTEILPYETPWNELTMMMRDELSYCFNETIPSVLVMESITQLSDKFKIPVIKSIAPKPKSKRVTKPKNSSSSYSNSKSDSKPKSKKEMTIIYDVTDSDESDNTEIDLPVRYKTKAEQLPKKRGRPKKQNFNVEVGEPKKRGRPPKPK
jgi:hypothetical protein